MAIIFDSNVWIAILNENDAHHEKAQSLFAENTTIIIPEYLILEITTVLQLRANKQIANLFAKMVATTGGLESLYASDDFFLTVLRFFNSKPKNFLLWIVHYGNWLKITLFILYDEVLAQSIKQSAP
jgi:predicted nucleic acid-binding protein